jgi:hypothetical protein
MRAASHYSAKNPVDGGSVEELGFSLKPEEAIKLLVVNGVDFDMAGWFCHGRVSRGCFWEVGVVLLEISDV